MGASGLGVRWLLTRFGGLSAVAAILLTSACGGGETASVGPKAALQWRAEAALAALSDERWLDFHRYYSPLFRKKCPAGEFVKQASYSLEVLRGQKGVEKGEKLEFRLVDVALNGTKGMVEIELFYQGTPHFFGGEHVYHDPDRWVFIDGQWWTDEEASDEGCPRRRG